MKTIKYKYNSVFMHLSGGSYDITTPRLPKRLMAIITAPIVKIDDCYYFEKFATNYSTDFQDKTGNEGFNNHFYIDDYCRAESSLLYKIDIARCLVNKLSMKLSDIEGRFIIMLQISPDNTKIEELMQYSVSIRFWKQRRSDLPYFQITDATDIGILQVYT